jgi:hypothetical protein
MIEKINAILSLVPDAEVVVRDNNIVEWINPSVAPITDAEINAEIARLQADYDDKEYQRDRAKEYPSIVDQLDTLYHGGYDVWKASIDVVKNKYPKGAA